MIDKILSDRFEHSICELITSETRRIVEEEAIEAGKRAKSRVSDLVWKITTTVLSDDSIKQTVTGFKTIVELPK